MRFGLVGAGEIGRIRAEALAATPDCTLTAVADTHLERARSVAAPHQAEAAGRLQQLVSRDDVDAVVVSTPPDSHEEIALAALEAGKHVICEKPLAPSVAACRRIVDTASERNRVVATGFCQRYFPAIRFVKETVDGGVIGELNHVRAAAGHTGLSEFREPWMHENNVVGGGALMDNGIHVIDLVHHILGDVSEVYGAATNQVWKLDGAEDNGFALLRNAAGKVATLRASWSEWRGYRFFVEAYGNLGMVRASYAPMFSMAVYLEKPGIVRRRKYNLYPAVFLRERLWSWTSTVRLAFQEEFADFLRLTEGETSVIADGFAGLRAVEIAHAIYKSSESHRPVTLLPPD